MTPETAAAGQVTTVIEPEAAPQSSDVAQSADVGHTTPTPRRTAWRARFGLRLSALYLWILFMVLFSLVTPSTFLTSGTFRIVFSQGVVTCVLALAFLVPLAAGAYDLSIGAVMSLALAISVYLQLHTGLSPVLGALIALLACAFTGFVSGFIVVRLHVNSFIATLGVSQILFAAVLLISSDQQLTGTFPSFWTDLGNNDIAGIPIVVLFLLGLALVLWYVFEFTRVGRYLFATGGNPDASRLSGVRTDRVVWGSLVVSATIAGSAGVIYSMQTGIFSSSIGPGYLFPAVAAVFLGASQLSRRPNVSGNTDRVLRARLRHPGPGAFVELRIGVEPAAVPGCVPDRRGGAGQPAGDAQAQVGPLQRRAAGELTNMSHTTPLLSIRQMSKTFPGTKALDQVDLDLQRGEVHALVGQNGSGKSTLIKLLAGYHPPDPGTVIELEGEEFQVHDTAASHAAGLRFVHQDLGLVHSLSTVENLALGRGFQTGFGGRIRWRAERRDAEQRMQALGYRFDVSRPVAELRAAERTGIAIARALHDWEQARVLVVDEPTAALPRHEVTALFEAIERVRLAGLGVIYVSHRLDEIFTIAGRVSVLREGRRVGTYATADIDQDRLVSLMVGDEQMRPPHLRDYAGEDDAVLQTHSLCGVVVDNVELVARRGEVVGIAGLTGSGREEILPLIFGVASRNGQVTVEGRSVPATTRAAMDAGLALVPADRHGEGSITTLTVLENCTLTDLRRHSRRDGAIRRSEERREVAEWIRGLDIRPPRSEAVFATLSGGNQQKVVLAKWLRREPRVLLLDEPTQGVDVHAKATIHALAREVASRGCAVVMASSDDAELCDTCDRVLVMRDGRIVGDVQGDRLTPEEIARLQLEWTKAA